MCTNNRAILRMMQLSALIRFPELSSEKEGKRSMLVTRAARPGGQHSGLLKVWGADAALRNPEESV